MIGDKSDENYGISEVEEDMSECKDYKITVTIGMDYEVTVHASDFESASKMGEEYVKRHFLEMEPEDKPFIREVRTEEAS